MNKSIALILSMLVASPFAVGCSSSSDKSTGASGAAGSDDSGSAGKGSSAGGGHSAAAGSDGNAAAGDSNAAAGDGNTDPGDGSSAAGDTGDGGTSNQGGSSNANGGTAGMAMPTDADCKTLETCCVDLTAGPQEACNHIAGLNYGPSCKSTYSLYSCDSVIAAANQPKTTACTTDNECVLSAYFSAVQASSCASAGGVASETCPSAGVTGCCKLSATTELCTYTGNDEPITESDCTSENGTFSATP